MLGKLRVREKLQNTKKIPKKGKIERENSRWIDRFQKNENSKQKKIFQKNIKNWLEKLKEKWKIIRKSRVNEKLESTRKWKFSKKNEKIPEENKTFPGNSGI